jgi:hypothetical protein
MEGIPVDRTVESCSTEGGLAPREIGSNFVAVNQPVPETAL